MLPVELTPRSGVEQVTRAWHAARHAARAALGGSLQTRACALCIRAADSFAYDLPRFTPQANVLSGRVLESVSRGGRETIWETRCFCECLLRPHLNALPATNPTLCYESAPIVPSFPIRRYAFFFYRRHGLFRAGAVPPFATSPRSVVPRTAETGPSSTTTILGYFYRALPRLE